MLAQGHQGSRVCGPNCKSNSLVEASPVKSRHYCHNFLSPESQDSLSVPVSSLLSRGHPDEMGWEAKLAWPVEHEVGYFFYSPIPRAGKFAHARRVMFVRLCWRGTGNTRSAPSRQLALVCQSGPSHGVAARGSGDLRLRSCQRKWQASCVGVRSCRRGTGNTRPALPRRPS